MALDRICSAARCRTTSCVFCALLENSSLTDQPIGLSVFVSARSWTVRGVGGGEVRLAKITCVPNRAPPHVRQSAPRIPAAEFPVPAVLSRRYLVQAVRPLDPRIEKPATRHGSFTATPIRCGGPAGVMCRTATTRLFSRIRAFLDPGEWDEVGWDEVGWDEGTSGPYLAGSLHVMSPPVRRRRILRIWRAPAGPSEIPAGIRALPKNLRTGTGPARPVAFYQIMSCLLHCSLKGGISSS